RHFGGSAYFQLKGAKWGLLTKKGEEVLKPQFDEISKLFDDVAYTMKGAKVGLLSHTGSIIINPIYSQIGNFNKRGLAAASAKKGTLVGYINKEGKEIVPVLYKSVGFFLDPKLDSIRDNISTLRNSIETTNNASEKRRIIETIDGLEKAFGKYDTGNQNAFKLSDGILDSPYPYLWFTNDAYKNMKKPKSSSFTGIYDLKGNLIIPQKKMYTVSYAPTDGMVIGKAFVGKELKKVFYNLSTSKIIPLENDRMYSPFNNGSSLSTTEKGENFYFVDKTGQKCSDTYTKVYDASENYRVAIKDGKAGLLDSLRNITIPFIYDDIKSTVSEGLIGVCKDKKWGILTAKGKEITPFIYDAIGYFNNGVTRVNKKDDKNNLFGIIDKNGNIVVPIKWHDIKLLGESLTGKINSCWVTKDSLYSRYDLLTNRVDEVNKFNRLILCIDGSAFVSKKNEWGYSDENGILRIPCKMDSWIQANTLLKDMDSKNIKIATNIYIYRFSIYNTGLCNTYKLIDKIPENKWDY
ncbi:MAG: WG repeat-containing protein, partial [Bacteroidaceae bacterium]